MRPGAHIRVFGNDATGFTLCCALFWIINPCWNKGFLFSKRIPGTFYFCESPHSPENSVPNALSIPLYHNQRFLLRIRLEKSDNDETLSENLTLFKNASKRLFFALKMWVPLYCWREKRHLATSTPQSKGFLSGPGGVLLHYLYLYTHCTAMFSFIVTHVP